VPADSATVTTVSDTSANVNQVSQVTVAGTIEAGDSYTLSIGGDSVSHTVSTGESIADIRDSLLTSLDADATISTTVRASAGSEDGQIILTATTAGVTFAASGSTQNTTSLSSTDDNAATVSHELSGTDTFGAIYGGDGHDALMGGGAADNLFGGDGDDRVAGSRGDDVLEGNAGEDKLQGGSGDDRIDGGIGNDLIQGGSGDDVMIGGAGDDMIAGGDGDDVALYSGEMSDYRLDMTNRTLADGNTADGDDGTDTLGKDVETVQFSDGELTFSGDTEDEFRVNTFTHNDQVNASVDKLAAGGYVVVWQS
jgi:Ca2+-binding RTX toxin-like protein